MIALFICFVLFLSNPVAAAALEQENNRTVKAGVFSFDGYHMQDSSGHYTG